MSPVILKKMLRILKASDLYINKYKNHIPKPNTKFITKIFKLSMPMQPTGHKSQYSLFAELRVDSLHLSPSIFLCWFEYINM